MTPTESQRRLVIVRRLREICDRDRSCFSTPPAALDDVAAALKGYAGIIV